MSVISIDNVLSEDEYAWLSERGYVTKPTAITTVTSRADGRSYGSKTARFEMNCLHEIVTSGRLTLPSENQKRSMSTVIFSNK